MQTITTIPTKNTITKLKGNIYFQGAFIMRDFDSNYAYPLDFPTIFTAKGAGIKSGNWQSCTGTNTPNYIAKYYSQEIAPVNTIYDIKPTGLTESEKYELFGLWDSIAKVAEAYSVVKFGNHGTSAGTDIKDNTAALALFTAIKPMAQRANELLGKMPTLN